MKKTKKILQWFVDCISNTFQFWLSKKSYKRRKRDTEKKKKQLGSLLTRDLQAVIMKQT